MEYASTFNAIDNILRNEAGCSTELDYIEQTSWLLFLKYLDDLEREREDKAMLSGRRFVRVVNPGVNNIYSKPEKDAKVIAKVEDGVVGEVEKCPENVKMCLIKFDNVQGWMRRSALFGIYDKEVIK